jgi:hypothetical protein
MESSPREHPRDSIILRTMKNGKRARSGPRIRDKKFQRDKISSLHACPPRRGSYGMHCSFMFMTIQRKELARPKQILHASCLVRPREHKGYSPRVSPLYIGPSHQILYAKQDRNKKYYCHWNLGVCYYRRDRLLLERFRHFWLVPIPVPDGDNIHRGSDFYCA